MGLSGKTWQPFFGFWRKSDYRLTTVGLFFLRFLGFLSIWEGVEKGAKKSRKP